MARPKSLRPRTLSALFGAYLLVLALVSWWWATSGGGSGWKYSVDTTRWAYLAYMVTAGALLSGIAIVAMSGMRDLDRRIEDAEGAPQPAGPDEPRPEAEPAPDPDAVPPPLAEEPVERDHVDQDIDELLVSLQEIETSAEGASEVTETVVAEVPAQEPRRVVRKTLGTAPLRLARLKEQRALLPGFFAGPALATIGIIGISAALMPGTESMLQTYYQLNTALLLGIGYAYVGVAFFTAAASYAMLRKK